MDNLKHTTDFTLISLADILSYIIFFSDDVGWSGKLEVEKTVKKIDILLC